MKTDLAQQLRKAIRESGLNRHELSQRTGLSYSMVHGFVAGDRDIVLGTASRIAAVLGLELRAGSSGKGKVAHGA